MSAPVIVSYGMGVNSTAALVRLAQRRERVDLILAADTGDENPATYRYRDEVFGPWLVAQGLPEITVVRWIRMDGTFESLSANCLRTHSLPSKAYGLAGCTTKWKIQPIEKFVRGWTPAQECWAAGRRVTRIIGYHAQERRRVDARRENDRNDPLFAWRYPLVEEGIDHDDCLDVISGAGLPIPPRSLCRFCPNKSESTVLQMRTTDPEGLALGLAIEANARIESPDIKGLGRSRFSWADLLRADAAQVRIPFRSDDELPCGCADGDA